ncbi:MAG: glucosyltransferase domain-containing protein [Deltaproteobacteria bacterium]|nr:glucosyltransferase domain-containing protein [Deltaproteobacteria bacterium]
MVEGARQHSGIAAWLQRFAPWTGALLVIAWLPFLTRRLLSTDDYTLISARGLGETPQWMLTQGRFVGASLHVLATWLGLDPVRSAPAAGLVAIGLCVLSGFLLTRLWQVPGERFALTVLVAVLPFVHPLEGEVWTFRLAPLHVQAGIALALGGLVLARREAPRSRLAGIALLTAALGTYQVALNVALVVIGMGAAIAVCGAQDESLRGELVAWARALVALVLAGLAWLLISRGLLAALGLKPEYRNGLIGLTELPARVHDVTKALARVAFRERQLSTPLLIGLQLALAAVALASMAWRASRERLQAAVLIALLVALSLCGTVGVLALIKNFEAAPRMLIAAGFLWAGLLVLAAQATQAVWVTRAALAIACGCVIGYVGVNHRLADEVARLNQRDAAVAARVLARFESDPRAASLARVVTIGHSINYDDLPTVANFIAPSALAVPWSQAPLFSGLAQRPLATATDEDVETATRLCAAASKWPATDSTRVTDTGLGVVCF